MDPNLMEKLTADFEELIENTPVSLTRQDIRKCFQRALAFFRDKDEVEKIKPWKKCKACNVNMEYNGTLTFDDKHLGLADEWYQCPECGKRETIGRSAADMINVERKKP